MNRPLQEACERLSKTIHELSSLKDTDALIVYISGRCTEAKEYGSTPVLPTTGIAQFIDIIIFPQLSSVIGLIEESDEAAARDQSTSTASYPLVSVQHLRVIYTSLELLWRWGLRRPIEDASDFHIELSAVPKMLLLNEEWLLMVDSTIELKSSFVDGNQGMTMSCTHIHNTVRASASCIAYADCMQRYLCNPLFGTMVDRNIVRLVLTLFTLLEKIGDNESSTTALVSLAKALLDQLLESNLDVLLVSNLPSLLRGNQWLKKHTSSALSRILLKSDGLLTVFQGYLDDSTQSTRNATVQTYLAKLVTSIPSTMCAQEYFSNICTQLVDVVHRISANVKSQHYAKVCAMIISRLSHLYPQICDVLLIYPLLRPIIDIGCFGANQTEASPIEHLFDRNSVTLYRDIEVEKALAALRTIATALPISSTVWASLFRVGVIQGIVLLYVHALSSSTTKQFASLQFTEQFCQTCLRQQTEQTIKIMKKLLFYYPPWSLLVSTARGGIEVRQCVSQSTKSESALNTRASDNNTPVSSLGDVLEYSKRKGINSSASNAFISEAAEDTSNVTLTDVLSKAKNAAVYSAVGAPNNSASLFLDIHDRTKLIVEILCRYEGALKLKLDKRKASQMNDGPNADTNMNDFVFSESPTSAFFLESLSWYFTGSDFGISTAINKKERSCSYTAESFEGSGDSMKRDTDPCATINNEDMNSYVGFDNWKQRYSSVRVARKLSGGVLIMMMQERIPIEALLKNRSEVLALLFAVVKGHAERICEPPLGKYENTGVKPLLSTASSATKSKDGSTKGEVPSRPLIVEINLPDPSNDAANRSDQSNEEDEEADCELIDTAFLLLANVLSLGSRTGDPQETSILRSFTEPLQTIALHDSNTSLSQSAVDIGLMIVNMFLTDANQKEEKLGRKSTKENRDTKEEAVSIKIEAICSEYISSVSPAMRGYGVHQISNILKNMFAATSTAQPLTSVELKFIVDALIRVLGDTESFVFLAAVLVIRLLATRHLVEVFSLLHAYYAGSSASTPLLVDHHGMMRVVSTTRVKDAVGEEPVSETPEQQDSAYHRSLPLQTARTRSMIGEVLVSIIGRHKGTLAMEPLLAILITTCTKLAQARSTINDAHEAQASISVNLRTMKIQDISNQKQRSLSQQPQEKHPERSTESATLDTSSCKNRRDNVNTIAEEADQVLLRMSALSVLAECIVSSSFATQSKFFSTVLDIATGILLMEMHKSESAQAGRRSAVFLVHHIISSFGAELLTYPEGDAILSRCFRAIKRVLSGSSIETDAVVRFQAENVMAMLDQMARSLFTTPDTKLLRINVDGNSSSTVLSHLNNLASLN